MFSTILVILVVGGFAVYVMTPAERLKSVRSVEIRLWRVNDVVGRVLGPDDPAFRAALRARTRMPIAVPAILGLHLLVFMAMSLAGSFADSAMLVGWGANFGPRTSQGEWWRIVTTLFVHTGAFHLILMAAAFAQPAIMLERMLGPFAIAAVFMSAGMFAGLESVSSHPLRVAVGPAGGILGIYGLLGATMVWNVLQQRSAGSSNAATTDAGAGGDQTLNLRGTLAPLEENRPQDAATEIEATSAVTPIVIPLKVVRRLAPVAAVFGLYVLVGGFGTPEISALLAGFLCGLVFARRSNEQTAPVVHVGGALATAMIIIIASAAMLHGIADVRPELARVVALESSTAGTYEKAVVQFKNGALSAQALEKVITQKIVPELRQAHERLKAVSGVPAQHQPLVASAEEYLRLRDESWRLRADALRKSNMMALRAADRSERASLEALGRIRPMPAPSDEKIEAKSKVK